MDANEYSESRDPSVREVGQLVRGEVNNFFDRLENVTRVMNDHQIAVLQLLPEDKRVEFLLTSQTNAIAFLENLADKTFETVNKVIDKVIE